MKKYSKQEKKQFAYWAADCAERVLTFFEKEFPKDCQPRKAIDECRTFAQTGICKMADIRKASLAAHTSARKAKEETAARFAARAAGQAVAAAHVTQHAFGAAYYALKAVLADDPDNAESKVVKERNWQLRKCPKNLRQIILKTITIEKKGSRILVRIKKGRDF